MTSDFRGTLGPRLSQAAEADLRVLANELTMVVLRNDAPDARFSRLANTKLSNKGFYSISFRHLQIDDVADKVWRTAAPLKCKIFCWLARKKRLPTNERRFRHHLAPSAACMSCNHDEDTDHLLLLCPRALEVWTFFYSDYATRGVSRMSDLWTSMCRSFEEATITTAILWNVWKRRNARTFNGVDEDLAFVSRSALRKRTPVPEAERRDSVKNITKCR
ncbi:uncharacterized protein [Lolium perenne]|uniref:uncharacterized protein n=1 Tax=Lolium perenne TaxID=4522 RepID=UPI003A9A071A